MSDCKAEITQDGRIRLECTAGFPVWVNRIPGAKRMRDGSWQMPLTLDTCAELRRFYVDFSEALADYEKHAEKVRKYVDGVKGADHVEPLQPIPIKAPYALYQHQVKAYNIALALFGRGAKRGGDAK